MSTYYPLYRWLQTRPGPEARLTFGQIEEILKRNLPESAKLYTAWWANEDPDKTRHVQCRAWRLAGWTAFPDVVGGMVLFKREAGVPSAPSAPLPPERFLDV